MFPHYGALPLTNLFPIISRRIHTQSESLDAIRLAFNFALSGAEQQLDFSNERVI